MDIKITQNATTLWLNGSGVAGAVKAARFADNLLTEIEMVLEGTMAAMATALVTVERMLLEAERGAGLPGDYPVRVVVVTPEGETWQSPLLGGWTEVLGGVAGRKTNNQAVKLHLKRDAFWERSDITLLTTTNYHGSGYAATVSNYNNATHSNYVAISGASVVGDVPAPVVLSINKAGLANGEVFVGQSVFSDGTNYAHQVEGEAGGEGAGITSVHTADAACSGGNYDALSWNGAGLVSLKTMSMNGVFATAAGGRVFRPLIRLQALVTGGEKIWANWRTAWDNGSSFEMLQEAEGILLPTDRRLVAFPSMYIPPWPVVDYNSDAVALCLMGQAVGAGAHALALDFVQFMPMDGWLHFIPLAATLTDLYLNYDSGRDLVTRSVSIMQSHYVEGAGIKLYPGVNQRLYFLTCAGALADTAWQFVVTVGYRARKRVL